ncbi:hypothetical protein CPB84DRAFT_1814851 [Gymnopilus junonius]|uniref:Protein kinase domain-containing protein n=1 Tax=Gymnopilus junonius TaxID=109634 RepID=A0A9P5TPI8_GYMJU|nr:hypothetical protein CPB84DRAFT_1814851 [Gymnopilus junonius]
MGLSRDVELLYSKRFLCSYSPMTTPADVEGIIEDYWHGKEPWFKSRGYQLHPRYKKGWVPSWVTNPPSWQPPTWNPPARGPYHAPVIDAIRIRDDKAVVLKRTFKHAVNGEETKLTAYFSSPSLRYDFNNHCIPLLDVMDIPDDENFAIIVVPLLRPFNSPRFDTVGECVDLFQQIFKGLQFIHHQQVAHRDCSGWNLMMDGTDMFPEGWHPIRPTRNREYTGHAKSDMMPQAIPMHGNDRTVPEFQSEDYQSRPLNPFPTDIYYLGNLIQTNFTEGGEYTGAKFCFDFMKPLVADMVQEDPAKRPTIDECVARLDEIVSSLSSWKLRSQVNR